ncbi:MAG: hypothetical protein J6X59_02450 [Bacteroidales bacterium]|nr:hypothetical protein [Bacteroidales bacterium]
MVYNGQQIKMKKSIFIIVSISAVVLLSSFVIEHNVTSSKSDCNVSISDNDGWEYYKPVTIYYGDKGSSKGQYYIWKKNICGDPDYLICSSRYSLDWTKRSISKNYNYGKDIDWTTEYKYTFDGYNIGKAYFSTYLPGRGWDD